MYSKETNMGVKMTADM